MKHIYSSIDIGSDSIKIVVCELFKNKLNLLAASSYKSKGIKKGVVVDVELARITIKQAFNEIEQMLGIKINRVIASVPSYSAEYSLIKGTTEIDNEEKIITNNDILKSLQVAISSANKNNKELVTVLPIDYCVDDNAYVSDPLGMIGNKLSIRAMMVTVPKKNLYSVVGLLENMGIEVVDISLNNIGDLYAFKNKSFDNKVGAIINIGGDITTVSLYNKGVVVKSSIIDMAGNDIDKDISYMYKVNETVANKLKTKFALAHKKNSNVNEYYEVETDNGEKLKINQFEVSEVVMSRIEEILNLAKKELNLLTSKRIDYIIITGGTSNMVNIEYVANDIFANDVKIGNIKMLGIRNNKYSSSIGNIVYFISKLKLKNKNYSMLSSSESEELAVVRRSSHNSSDSMLGKIFGYFFKDNEN